MARPPRAPSFAKGSISVAHTPSLDTLPAELVAEVLEHLPLDKLWTAARVSRQFYAAVWRVGLFIHRRIEWDATTRHTDQLAVFKDVLEQAQRKDLRVGLSLICRFPNQHNQPFDADRFAAFQLGADEIVPVLSAALPLLVQLSIEIPDQFRAQVDGALKIPAPRLSTLEISRPMAHAISVVPVPRDLFGGSASLLRSLTLDGISLPEEAVPAFRSLSHAVLRHQNRFPYIDMRSQFPNVTSLHLEFVVWVDGGPVLPDRFTLAGIPLRSVVIEDNNTDASATPVLDAVERSFDLSTIPTVMIVGRTLKWNETIWSNDASDISVRLRCWEDERQGLLVLVSPEHRRWRRVYRLPMWFTNRPLPIRELPGLSARLTYLRLDVWFVSSVLKMELSFPALRGLKIDMRPGYVLQLPDYNDGVKLRSFAAETLTAPRVWAPCPALTEITLFSLHNHKTLKAVDSRRIAVLAHALGQSGRPSAQRAALALVGVQFAKPVARTLLGETVSGIRQRAFAGRGSREDHDQGLGTSSVVPDL